MFNRARKDRMPSPEQAPPGRSTPMSVPDQHFTLRTPLDAKFDSFELAMFGMGCFWGAERDFWQAEGVHSTAVGYAAGYTPNPTYQEVCSGQTGHNEVVRVVFDPARADYETMLRIFWESHDPTQFMRQGNDTGTQYRSGIYAYSEEQERQALASKETYQRVLTTAGHREIATEIITAPKFFFAEAYHQQYLAKNPGGYCGLGGTGVSCPSFEL